MCKTLLGVTSLILVFSSEYYDPVDKECSDRNVLHCEVELMTLLEVVVHAVESTTDALRCSPLGVDKSSKEEDEG